MAVEALLAAFGVHALTLSAVAMAAPGLALMGLLPRRVREARGAALAAAPVLGFAATSVALITVARIGIPLGQVSVRLVLAALVGAGVALWPSTPPPPLHPGVRDLLEAVGLLAALGLSVVLSLRVVGHVPVPGNDWAKYLLYADEIRRHGSLLIDNPYWMLGVPFREDPSVPAVYGSVLIASRAPAGALAQGIMVFSGLQVLALYAYARASSGRLAGVLAAALLAVVPASQDILGWHGLPNLAALALIALLLSYLAAAATARLERAEVVGFALVAVAIVAAHRFSAAVAVGVAVVTLLAALVAGGRHVARDTLRVLVAAIILGLGVGADIYARQRTFGGALPYTDYLDTKLDLTLAVRDLSWWLVGAAGAAVLGLLVLRRLERAAWPAVALVAVPAALGYAWVLHLSLYYSRVVYFVPAALAALAAAGASRLRPSAVGAVLGAAAIALVLHASWPQARSVRDYYAFAGPTSLKGLDALSAQLRPGEVVVTDRCWSFLGTWLLHTRTLAALEPQDIQPRAELPFARMAKAVMRGGPRGRAIVARLGIRYAIIDPVCPGPDGAPLAPPRHARAVYASPRLAIVRLR